MIANVTRDEAVMLLGIGPYVERARRELRPALALYDAACIVVDAAHFCGRSYTEIVKHPQAAVEITANLWREYDAQQAGGAA